MSRRRYANSLKGFGPMHMQGRINLLKDCKTEEDRRLFEEANKLLRDIQKKNKKDKKNKRFLSQNGIVD